MVRLSAILFGIGLAVLPSQALLIEEFKNSQIDYVPSPTAGRAPNTVNGYLFPYSNTGSYVYKGGLTTVLTAAVLNAAATYQSPNGLAFDLALGGTATDKYAGIGFQFLKPTGSTAVPIYHPVDLSDYTSVIITYSATRPLILEWQQSDTENDGAAFFCQLPTKAIEGTHTCLLAEQTDSTLGFKQPYWATDPAKIKSFDKSTAIGLKFVIKSGVAGAFVLKGIHLDNTDQEWPVLLSSSAMLSSFSALSSSSVSSPSSSAVGLSSSSAVVLPSSSSIAPPLPNLVWIPSLVNQVEFNGMPGGYWYGYASTTPAGTYTPADFSTITGPIVSTLNPVAASGYAAIGFDWVDNGESTIKGTINLAGKTSLCISYSATKAFNVLLKQSDLGDACGQYILSIPAMATAGTAELLLSGFKKEGTWGGAACAIDKNLALQTGVHIQNKALPSGTITISKIGFNGYCGTPTVTLGGLSSSIFLISSSSKPLLSSSSGTAPHTSSASVTNPVCMTILPGHAIMWMLEDDNQDGLVNYKDTKHACYQGAASILNVPSAQGFGILKLSSNDVTIRTKKAGLVKLDVISTDGRVVRSIFTGTVAKGIITLPWNGKSLASGLYHIRLTVGGQTTLQQWRQVPGK